MGALRDSASAPTPGGSKIAVFDSLRGNSGLTMNEKYQPQEIEAKWQRRWAEEGTFRAETGSGRPEFYVVEMLAYTSGRLHMGHVENYSIGDALAWYKRLRGHN